MLSRVAQRVYWLGRYMERLENTARLINVNTNLLLDLPRGTNLGWSTLLDITGSHEEFERKQVKEEEINIIRFLVSDLSNSISIMSSLNKARENGRTTREIIPTEAWELINDLYFYVKENAAKSVARKNRQRLLRHIIQHSQQFTGVLTGTMSHTSAYDFIRLGRNLERADMTTRIIDVGTVNLVTNPKNSAGKGDSLEPFINILWMSVLQSLSAYQMYRQHVQDRVNGEDVVMFTLQDGEFPRSVFSCLAQIKVCLRGLPKGKAALHALALVEERIIDANLPEILEQGKLHDFIDDVQLDIASLHEAVARSWFLPV
ncbi:MAG: alpha-E domain-containing protein [Cellvibrionaceae bacterium]